MKKRITTIEKTAAETVDLRAMENAELAGVEELVLRMRLGAGVSDLHQLEKRGDTNPETRAKLAMIEQMLLEQLQGPGDQSRKGKVIERLKKLQ